ncbi:hypothetical protein BDF22DRAFT_741240 [Syncephalis plumigaleata]|nr:hypothetical protein BDF22DRAFT_741240 [Syncephalis plumigaleata]
MEEDKLINDSSTIAIASNPDESLIRPPTLPASPSGSLRFARPARPGSRNNRRHSLVGIFPSPTNAGDTSAETTTTGMQRSASYAPSSGQETAKDESNDTPSRYRRPVSYHAGFQRNFFTQTPILDCFR